MREGSGDWQHNVIIGSFELHRSGGLLLGPPALNKVSWEVCLDRSGFLPVKLLMPPSKQAGKASPDSIAWPISQYKSSSLFSAWTCHISAYCCVLSSHHTPLWAAWLWFLGNLSQGWRSCCCQVQSPQPLLTGLMLQLLSYHGGLPPTSVCVAAGLSKLRSDGRPGCDYWGCHM